MQIRIAVDNGDLAMLLSIGMMGQAVRKLQADLNLLPTLRRTPHTGDHRHAPGGLGRDQARRSVGRGAADFSYPPKPRRAFESRHDHCAPRCFLRLAMTT